MSDITLKRLRSLRERARHLHRDVADDLAPFSKSDGTFRRKPDSPAQPGDINVTTTCSSLMALAATNSFTTFYRNHKLPDGTTPTGLAIFRKLFQAPWMSSGLSDNNAFTTTLVLRAYGYLRQKGLLDHDAFSPHSTEDIDKRFWETDLGISNIEELARILKMHPDKASRFLWFSMSDTTRDSITQMVEANSKDTKRLTRLVASDLGRLIQGGWIYEEERFPNASEQTKKLLLTGNQNRYDLVVANRALIADQFPQLISRPTKQSILDIAKSLAANADNFSINDYPPSAAVVYWFVDAIWRAGIVLPKDEWGELCTWAAKEFNHRRSLVVAEHDAMMDPVAMGMAACLCARLLTLGKQREVGPAKEHIAALPSLIELEHSIDELVSKQTESGIWNKYFPLFHYQDAGSNFCFAFELLEAMLCEFGPTSGNILERSSIVTALEKAVTWCETNKLPPYVEQSLTYSGWNSGGQLSSLEAGQPESWATAVVHMFLHELVSALSQQIQKIVLTKYKVRLPEKLGPTSAINDLLDIDILFPTGHQPLSKTLYNRIIEIHKDKTENSLREQSSSGPVSALLFGPPGTSKTQVTKAVADDLQWKMVEITPSEFLKGNLDNIYLQSNEIFEDLMDLSGVVILFDEMDALVQTRDGDKQLDIASQFLTTSMLPKLTDLHDQGQVVFFMATNFQDRFDAAIKRAGRFDLLLCMGPPTLEEKLNRLHLVLRLDSKNKQALKAGQIMRGYLKNEAVAKDKFSLLTFGEYKAFLKQVGKKDTLGNDVEKLTKPEFLRKLEEISEHVTLRVNELPNTGKKKLAGKSLAAMDSLQFSLKDFGNEPSQIVRYLCSRKESRDQH